MATFPSRSRSRPPVARAPAGIVTTARDSHFSWVMPERLESMYQTSKHRFSNSLESLSESVETQQSSSVSSFDAGSPAIARNPQIPIANAPKKDALRLVAEPQIVEADPNPPLQVKKQKNAVKPMKIKTTSAQSSPIAPAKAATPAKVPAVKGSGKSLVPNAFKFKRSKTVPVPIANEEPAPKLARVPSMRSSLPIAARFAKSNRQSWIQKYGSSEGTSGPIVPSSKPTLSFIHELPQYADMPAPPVPPLPKLVRTPSPGEKVVTPERSLSPVSRALSPSPPASQLPYLRSRRVSPQLRVMSPSPDADIPATLPTPAAIRIMYPARKPAPTTPLPQPPAPEVLQPTAPVDIATPKGAFEESHEVTVGKVRRVVPPPLRGTSASPVSRNTALPPLPRSTSVTRVARASPSAPRQTAQADKPVRVGLPSSPLPSARFVAPVRSGRATPTQQHTRPAESALRRTSLDSKRDRATQSPPAGGRTTPLPATGRTTPSYAPEHLNVKPSMLRLDLPTAGAGEHYAASAPVSPIQGNDRPRVFTPAPSASSGLRRTPSLPPARRTEGPQVVTGMQRGREHPFPLRPLQRRQRPAPSAFNGSVTDDEDDTRLARVGFYLPAATVSATDLTSAWLRPPPINPRISEARSSVYSSASGDDDLFHDLMSEVQHDARRERLVDNVERIIMKDARAAAHTQ